MWAFCTISKGKVMKKFYNKIHKICRTNSIWTPKSTINFDSENIHFKNLKNLFFLGGKQLKKLFCHVRRTIVGQLFVIIQKPLVKDYSIIFQNIKTELKYLIYQIKSNSRFIKKRNIFAAFEFYPDVSMIIW